LLDASSFFILGADIVIAFINFITNLGHPAFYQSPALQVAGILPIGGHSGTGHPCAVKCHQMVRQLKYLVRHRKKTEEHEESRCDLLLLTQ
jgi:hypothetical protein